MKTDRALWLLTFAAIAAAFYYAARFDALQSTLDRAAIIRHEGRDEWIEVTQRGEVVSEWQPADGAVYEALDGALHDDE